MEESDARFLLTLFQGLVQEDEAHSRRFTDLPEVHSGTLPFELATFLNSAIPYLKGSLGERFPDPNFDPDEVGNLYR